MNDGFSRRFRLALTTLSAAWLATLLIAHATMLRGAPIEDPKTILDRVYSVAQADRGESVFKRSCTGCHAATDFAGGAISARWEERSLGDLFEVIDKFMPENAPGTLEPKEAAAVIAFFLHMDGYPVGYDDLPGDPDALAKIAIVPNPK